MVSEVTHNVIEDILSGKWDEKIKNHRFGLVILNLPEKENEDSNEEEDVGFLEDECDVAYDLGFDDGYDAGYADGYMKARKEADRND